MLKTPTKYWSQADLEPEVNVLKSMLLGFIQELVDANLLKLATQDGSLRFQAVPRAEAEKVGRMTDEEKMIYSHIEAAGRDGIWQKIIKLKTNLHQHIFTKLLKLLEQKRFVKSIKDVKHPTRKIYMLYNLQPLVELTGGPWFTDSELDTEFVEGLLKIVWRFVVAKSRPQGGNPAQCSYAASYSDYPTLEDILKFIQRSKVTPVELSLNDVKSICDVLIYQDKIERVPSYVECYRATWQGILEAGGGVPEGENPMALGEGAFSVYDFYKEVEPSKSDGNVMYLDSWINS